MSTPTDPETVTGPQTAATDASSASGPSPQAATVVHDALILAGGRGSRLGGHDKAGLELGGRPLLELVLDAVPQARTTVVVGQVNVPYGVLRTIEHPPGGGPVAGIAAGLATLRAHDHAPWTLVLAVDQPGAGAVVPVLLDAVAQAGPQVDVVTPASEQGGTWLLAAYRTDALHAALLRVGSPVNQPVHALVRDLRMEQAELPGELDLRDIDTWEDHHHWQERWGG